MALEITLTALDLTCLEEGINPTRFCSSCGSSNPHVVCDECIASVVDEMNEMVDAIADMEPEPMSPYDDADYIPPREREHLIHGFDGMNW